MRGRIEAIEYELPRRVVTNDDLGREHASWQMDKVEEKSGVGARHIAADGETAFDLAARACDRLFEREDRTSVDAVLFCTQTPDYVMPSNAFLLHRHLDLADGVLAFDYNLACSGFTYGLAIAQGLLAAELARRVLLVTADTYSKLINPGDRSARVLFGDGAAATLVGPSPSSVGFVDFDLATSGKNYDRFWIPAGGYRLPRSPETSVPQADANGNVRTKNDIHMDGMGVWAFINSFVPGQVRNLLKRNGRTTEDVDLYLFHQASRMTLDSLVRLLALRSEQVFGNLETVGNTVSSSLPILLKDAQAAGRIRPGDVLVLAGFGVGLSSGALLMQA
jgi:3-oxoacyl-[acyl-carrier-protein] synthase-3